MFTNPEGEKNDSDRSEYSNNNGKKSFDSMAKLV